MKSTQVFFIKYLNGIMLCNINLYHYRKYFNSNIQTIKVGSKYFRIQKTGCFDDAYQTYKVVREIKGFAPNNKIVDCLVFKNGILCDKNFIPITVLNSGNTVNFKMALTEDVSFDIENNFIIKPEVVSWMHVPPGVFNFEPAQVDGILKKYNIPLPTYELSVLRYNSCLKNEMIERYIKEYLSGQGYAYRLINLGYTDHAFNFCMCSTATIKNKSKEMLQFVGDIKYDDIPEILVKELHGGINKIIPLAKAGIKTEQQWKSLCKAIDYTVKDSLITLQLVGSLIILFRRIFKDDVDSALDRINEIKHKSVDNLRFLQFAKQYFEYENLFFVNRISCFEEYLSKHEKYSQYSFISYLGEKLLDYIRQNNRIGLPGPVYKELVLHSQFFMFNISKFNLENITFASFSFQNGNDIENVLFVADFYRREIAFLLFKTDTHLSAPKTFLKEDVVFENISEDIFDEMFLPSFERDETIGFLKEEYKNYIFKGVS